MRYSIFICALFLCLNSFGYFSDEIKKVIELRHQRSFDEALRMIKSLEVKYADSVQYHHRFYYLRGNIYGDQGQRDAQIQEYLNALKFCEGRNDQIGVAGALINIGATYKEQDLDSEALVNYEQAFRIANKEGDSILMAATLKNISVSLRDLGRPQESISYLQRSTDIYAAIGRVDKVLSGYLSFGRLYDMLGEFRLSANYLVKYLESDSISASGEVKAYNNLGLAMEHLGILDSAETFFRKSYVLSTSRNFTRSAEIASRNLYELHQEQQNIDSAYKYLSINRELNVLLMDKQQRARILELQEEFESEKKQQIIEQKTRETSWLYTGLGGVIAFGFVFFLLVRRNYKTRERLAREQVRRKNTEIANLFGELTLQQARAQAEGELSERKRLSRELHDRIGPLLSSVKVKISSSSMSGNGNGDLEEGLKMLDSSVDEIRRISHHLNAGETAMQGLVKSIELLVERVQANSGMTINFHHFAMDKSLSQELESNLYAIVSELSQNALRYSKGTEMTINISRDEDELSLMVEDNGIGFDTSAAKTGIGLSNIRERVNQLHGEINIDSRPGRGTTAVVDIPLKQPEKA